MNVLKKKYREAKDFFEKHERYLFLGALAFGFTVDSLTLTRIDLKLDNLILFFYITVAGASIFLLNLSLPRSFRKIEKFLPYTLQYAFGGLFSGYVIFYSRSASLFGSWPFILMLLILLVGNEFFKKRYQRLTFQLSIYFIAIFSFSIFFIPVLIGKIGALIFLVSGLTSLIVIYLIVRLMQRLKIENIHKSLPSIKKSIAGIFILFNFLYFTNIIPPIPLSLKDFGIYYSVERVSAKEYVVEKEDLPWYKYFEQDVYKIREGQSLYSYSAVFAPTRFEISIIHAWSYYNSSINKWEDRGEIMYPIVGGRDGGYRGWTLKRGLSEGKWKVEVKTRGGQTLGRKVFNITVSDDTIILEREVK